MKVLLIHSSDSPDGGGQIGMNRLQRGLLAEGVDARVLCAFPTREGSLRLPKPRPWELRLRRFTRFLGLNDIHNFSIFRLPRMTEFKDADVFDIHRTDGGILNHLAFPRMTREKPGVLTLHDMTPFTGGCGVSWDCTRWESGCGRCPYPEMIPDHTHLGRDATAEEWKIRNWCYGRSRFAVISPSRWMYDKARRSMLARFSNYHIPYGLDTDLYRPLDPEACRSILGLPNRKKVILFVANRLRSHIKGWDLLVGSLNHLPQSVRKETILLTLGKSHSDLAAKLHLPVLQLGYVGSGRLKAIVFSAADSLVLPSRSDNLPMVMLEALACGTPVVAFRVGGIPEAVREGETGLLAPPEDSPALARAIEEMLVDDRRRSEMGRRARCVAKEEFSLSLQVRRTLEVYRSLVNMN